MMEMNLAALETVVFAGGGVRGLAYVGALQALRDERGIDFGARSPALRTVVGVSVGTLFALMVALAYSVAEITSVGATMRQSDVMATDPVRLLSGELSLDNGLKLRAMVESLLARKGVAADVTFEELFAHTSIAFHLIVTDLTTASVVHVSEKTHPHLSVVTAMVASMTLPLVYPPVLAPDGHLWVDGGVMENFPMTRYAPLTLLGFDFRVNADFKPETLLSYLTRVLYVQQVPLDAVAWGLMSKAHQRACVIIDTGNVTALQNLADLSPDTREALLRAGADAVRRKLRVWEGSEQEEDMQLRRGLPNFLGALETCQPLPEAYKD